MKDEGKDNFCHNAAVISKRSNEENGIPFSTLFKKLLDRKTDITKNVQRYIDFDKDVSLSPDAMIPEIVKEIKD